MSKKLWGGRFSKETKALVEEFTKSIQFDYKIAEFDLLGSMVHVMVLEKAGYLTSKESSKLFSALKSIFFSKKKIKFYKTSEDVHTNIQSLLQKRVGDLVLKLQTARSRNEQVVLATKLYCQFNLLKLEKLIGQVMHSLTELAETNKSTIIPGFTHMQHAQPVYLKDYLGAYKKMLSRDRDRVVSINSNIKLTIGAGALAGTPIEVGKYSVTLEEILKKSDNLKKFKEKFIIEPTTNSLDSVSDRDFVIESISAMSIVAMHLSRLAEDLIIWATKEFNFIEIDDSFCTGSSLMPQKKNPDVLELIRGYAGRLYGNLISVLTMMKGLPLTYNRDMQLDKEPLFNSFEIISNELKLLAGLIRTLKFNQKEINRHLKDESLYATDLVYYLVDKKIAFKEAHTIIGKLIKYSIDNEINIKNMTQDQLNRFSNKLIKSEIIKLFDPKVSVESKKSIKR